jgi:hypothetical protein
MFAHDVSVICAVIFLALTAPVLHGEQVRPEILFALVRELLSLAQRK